MDKGSSAVSKTVDVGSNPASPANIKGYDLVNV